MVRYDEKGDCTSCGLPATGFINDGVCLCLEREEAAERWDNIWDEIEAERDPLSHLEPDYDERLVRHN
jgi:hypothetical protein